MEAITISAEKRTAIGKGAARLARRNGNVPAVCYGLGKEPVKLAVQPKLIAAMLRARAGRPGLVQINVAGETTPRLTLIREYQLHPVKRSLLHIDFMELSADSPVVIKIPVRLTGKPEGIKTGGKLHHITQEIYVRGKPTDIPEEIVIDVTPLQGNDRINIDELPMPAGVKPVFKINSPVAMIKAIKEEVERPSGAESEAAEAEKAADSEKKSED